MTEDLHHRFCLGFQTVMIWQAGQLTIQEWIITWCSSSGTKMGQDGPQFIAFIATLWIIGCNCNNLVFWQQPFNTGIIQHQFQESIQQHQIFISAPTWHGTPDNSPTTPPGFLVANIGLHPHGTSDITLLTDDSWDSSMHQGGFAWVIENCPLTRPLGQGDA